MDHSQVHKTLGALEAAGHIVVVARTESRATVYGITPSGAAAVATVAGLLSTIKIELNDADWARFQAALAEPPKANPTLVELMRRTPLWAKNIVHRASKKKTPGAGATEVQKVKPRASTSRG